MDDLPGGTGSARNASHRFHASGKHDAAMRRHAVQSARRMPRQLGGTAGRKKNDNKPDDLVIIREKESSVISSTTPLKVAARLRVSLGAPLAYEGSMQSLVLGVCVQPLGADAASPRRPKNAISSWSARNLRRASAAPVKPSIPRSYALVVGIGKYREAPGIGATAIFRTGCRIDLFGPDQSGGRQLPRGERPSPDRQSATLANLRTEIEEWLPCVAKDDDRVLIYFAGHGFVHDGRRTWLRTISTRRTSTAPGTRWTLWVRRWAARSRANGKCC